MWVQKKKHEKIPNSFTYSSTNKPHFRGGENVLFWETGAHFHTSVYVKGLHHVSAEILIFHSEIYHFASTVPPKQVFLNIQQRETHLVVLVYQIKVFAYFPAK